MHWQKKNALISAFLKKHKNKNALYSIAGIEKPVAILCNSCTKNSAFLKCTVLITIISRL